MVFSACSLVVETELPISMTCSNTTGIEKGALVYMADLGTVALVTGSDQVVGGVAAEEKIASDGNTHIAVYRGGVFRGVASGNITTGDSLGSALISQLYNNTKTLPLSGCKIWGTSFEDCTDRQYFLFELKPQVSQGVA